MKFYFNTKYDTYGTRKSGEHYVKISCDTDVNGMFAVLCSKDKLSVQSFPDCTKEHLYGLTDKFHFSEEEFFNNVLPNLDNDTMGMLSSAMCHLERSYRNHVSKHDTTPEVQQIFYSAINQLNTKFFYEVENRDANVAKPKKKVVANWKDINDIVSSLLPESINKIVENLVNGNNETYVNENNEYRVVTDANGHSYLQYRCLDGVDEEETTVADNKSNVSNVPPAPVRKSEQLALMLDDTDLDEFVNGHFYKVKENNGGYAVLVSEAGYKRHVALKRIKMVNVFSEKALVVA